MKILCIIGRSGSGKSLLSKTIAESDTDEYSLVKSYSTRLERLHDAADALTHLFVTNEFYEAYDKDNILAFYDNGKTKYWVGKELLEKEKTNLYVIDIIGYENLKKNLTEAEIKAIYLDVSEETTMTRMKLRGDSKESIEARIKSDRLHLDRSLVPEEVIIIDANGTMSDVVKQLNNKMELV